MKPSFDKKQLIVSLMFIIMIFGGTLWSVFSPDTEFSLSENRYLQMRPKSSDISGNSIKDRSFMKKYENYISDQFFLRNQWVALKTNIERLCLKEESNEVYFGKDDYLIGIPQRSDYESERCKKNIEFLKQFIDKNFKKSGAEHVKAVFVPTSSQILKDKLPHFASPYDQSRLLGTLEDSLPQGSFISMLPVMSSHSSEDIYYRTDHHWTTLGAYYAYADWAAHMGITPCSIEDFNINNAAVDFQGTLQSKINIDTVGDVIQIFEPKENVSFKLIYNENPEDIRDMYDYEKLETKSKYDVFFGGNQSSIAINTTLPSDSSIEQKEGNLLIIKDSFANCFIPFAALHYKNTYVVDMRYFNLPLSRYMEEKGITDVLILYSTYNFVSDTDFPKIGM